MTWALVVVAYLTGAFPTSFLMARLVRRIDLREHGSGNLGATNALRVLGWRAATPIFIVDIAKGWFPVFAFPRWDGSPAAEWALAYGAAAVIGHVFSIYVGFRGGKGVATGAGVFLGLAPVAVLAAFGVWGLLVFGTGYVSLASIAAALAVPIMIRATLGGGPVFWLSVALAAFVVFAHRANLGRLARGEEHRFRRHVAGTKP